LTKTTTKLNIKLVHITSSCQYHSNTACVNVSHLQPTETAKPVQQHKAPCINSCVLLWKEALNYTFSENVTHTVVCGSTLHTTALLAPSALTQIYSVRERHTNYWQVHVLCCGPG